jgi:peptide subunit release factor RF-3
VEGVVPPDSQHFSGLVFKLQANMDPKHRDKVGCSLFCGCRGGEGELQLVGAKGPGRSMQGVV